MLKNNMIAHINAEIAIRSMRNLEDALLWVKSTFLFVRIQTQPQLYGLKNLSSRQEMDENLKALVTEELRKLAETGLIQHDEQRHTLESTEFGRLVYRHNLKFETALQFQAVPPTAGLPEILEAVSFGSSWLSLPSSFFSHCFSVAAHRLAAVRQIQ